MRAWAKAAVVVLVTLPVLAYVGGTLSAAPPDRGPRTPVILDGPATPTPSPAPSPSGGPREDDGKDEGEEEGEVQVVNPSPTRVGEDDGGTGDDEPDPDGDDGTHDDTTGGDD